jgi:hypothetical protein
LKTLLGLVLKDFKRDLKRPWSLALFAVLPVVMTALIAAIFGGRSGSAAPPTIHVAVLDEDHDLLGVALRFFSTRRRVAQATQLRFVADRDQGFRLLEERKASALVVLPEKMTENLVSGRAATIELYENPAEQYLPKIVRQEVTLLAEGLSGVAEVLQDTLRDIRDLFHADGLPTDEAVVRASLQCVQKLRRFETYLFPPLVQMETVPAAEYHLQTTPAVSAADHAAAP